MKDKKLTDLKSISTKEEAEEWEVDWEALLKSKKVKEKKIKEGEIVEK